MVTKTELDELNGTAERTALSVVISWALAARRDPPPSGLLLADDLDWASAQISFMMAEAERLRANQERMWCSACGTVTRDKQCDCTKFSDQDTQSLVNYADAMQEAAHEEAQENERLRAALQDIANPLQGIERRAKVEGCVVNYPMAQALAEQGSYLRALARDGLSACEQSAKETK